MGRGQNALYVGVGTGENLKQLSKNNEQLTGIDISSEMLKQAGQHIEENNLENVKLVQETIYNLPFEDESFDRVYCINTFFHLKNRKRAISEMSRVTKGGGLVYLEMYSLFNFACAVRRLLNFFLKSRPKVYPSYISVEIVNLIEKNLMVKVERVARRKSVMGKPELFFFVLEKEKIRPKYFEGVLSNV